jgi:ATP-binding cassette, subfamily C, type I secretion system permease/ATPase
VGRGSKRPRPQTCAVTRALRHSRGALLVAALASGGVNVLALTGPLYMLEVYNRVLPSGSISALVILSAAMLALYGLTGALDFARLRLVARAARRMDARLSARVFAVLPERTHADRTRSDGLQPLRDLDQIRAFLTSSAPMALFDMPWMPLYLGVVFLMHPALGAFAMAGAALLVALMLLAERRSSVPMQASSQSAGQRWALAAAACRHAETIRAMGFAHHLRSRWVALNACHLQAERHATRPANAFAAAIKVARPALQSGIVGLGAYLVVHGKASTGTMIAASIVVSRALAPVEVAIANWRGFTAARAARARLCALLAARPPRQRKAQLPRACRSLHAEQLAIAPPGACKPVVRGVSFALEAGGGLGIVGASASGKSTLARALVGACRPQRGRLLLDEHPLEDWTPDRLGRHIGYLPQDVALLAGTIADNIARFEAGARIEAVTAAARAAGVHHMIARLPAGYATEIGADGVRLSAGQRQRIALARALYGDPFLVVLDEPDASLDAEGARALSMAVMGVRRRGGIAIVIAHRLSALAGVDTVLALKGGRVCAYGPKDAVLSGVLMQNRCAPDAMTTAAE